MDGIYLPPPPELKTQEIELVAADSKIDISTLLTGYPVFQNRTGSLTYYLLEPADYDSFANVGGTQNVDDFPSAYDVYTQLMCDLHGQYGKMYFEDDPEWEYEGRFTIDSFDFDLRRSVTINYDVKPYKMKREVSSYTLNGLGGDPITWNYYPSSGGLTPSELGYRPTNPSITITGLQSDETCKIRIWKPDSAGNYTAATQYYIDRIIGGNETNKVYAEFLFYKNCRFCFLGPSGSSATFTFNQGRF
ncbi:MAG: hypothetical protein J6U54_15910 [Clostridiales bacterium]|nr:hypothetical protein [Clostridiales bacterium]